MRKILFIDVDGTLVDYDNVLSKSTIEAIRTSRKNGHLVILTTGRSKAEIYPEFYEMGIDGIIGGNGSYVELNGEMIMEQVVPFEDAKHIVDWLHSRKLEFYLESNNGLFASENFIEGCKDALIKYSAKHGKEISYDNYDADEIFPGMIYGGELYRKDLNKVSYALTSYQDYLDACEEFPHLQNGTWGGVGEESLFGDIGVKGVSKDKAINFLLDKIGAKVEDTIAFGDADVDISMFEYCGYSVAMSTGRQKARDAAKYVTDNSTNDGIYNACKYLKLI